LRSYISDMNKYLLIVAIGALLSSGCNFQREYPAEIDGYAPIYMAETDQFEIKAVEPQPYENPGKIYQYGSYTFQMDQGKGIHVINSGNPSQAVKIKFINVPGVTDISIKDNMLYTNNFRDLVSINITDINNISVSHRNKNVFPATLDGAPPETNIYFECIDNSKGVVVGWEKKSLQNPKCFRQ